MKKVILFAIATLVALFSFQNSAQAEKNDFPSMDDACRTFGLASFKSSETNSNTSVVYSDDQWEDYANGVKATSENGSGAFYNCTVQRRTWCGAPEYRILIPNVSFPVPVSYNKDNARYEFYSAGTLHWFNM